MQDLNLQRRLSNIQTDHVSLVDKAANKRKFVLIKHQGKEIAMEELKPILTALDGKLDAISKRLDAIEKVEPVTFLSVDKAGAKFSSATLTQLKSTISALQKLVGVETEVAKKEDEVNLTEDEMSAALKKGLTAALTPETKPDADAEGVIKEVIAKALASINGGK